MNDEDEIDSPVCLNCGSTNLYRDGANDDLICSDCNTQSQSYSQRETAEDADGTTTTNRRSSSIPQRSSRKSIAVVEDEIEEEYRLPTLMEFCEVFLELVESAAKKSVSEDVLPNLGHMEGFENYKEQIVKDSREIFFLFLERWDEAANYFMTKYQGVRVSLFDRFLTNRLRGILWKQLNQTCSASSDGTYNTGDIKKEWSDSDDDDEEGEDSPETQESQSNIRSPLSKSPKKVQWNDSQSTLLFDSQQSSIYTPPAVKLDGFETSTDDIGQSRNINDSHTDSWKRLKEIIVKGGMKVKDETVYLKLAIIELYPDLGLATSIVYLAHLCSQTGVASNNFVAWANMGKFPHLLDAFGQLSEGNQAKVRKVKKNWQQNKRHIISADKLDRTAITLLTCLVDPKETRKTFLSQQYELNVDRMENLPFLEKNHLHCLLKEKKSELKHRFEEKERELYQRMTSSDHAAAKASDQHKNEDNYDSEEQDSPIKALHLGQFSQESEGSLKCPDIPSTFYNVGLMANCFCAHLGVDSRVLDFTYALMGLPVYCNCEVGESWKDWLPAPLKLAQPSFIVSPLHLIAVIVAATKFVPGWEKSVVKLNLDKHEISSNASLSINDADISSSQNEDEVLLSSRSVKRRRLEKNENLSAAPSISNLSQLRFRNSNGDNAFEYLGFMPKNDSRGSISAEFRGALSSLPNAASLEEEKTKKRVKGCSILSGCQGNSQSISKELQSTNGLSEYYAHRGQILKILRVSRPYNALISYVSEKLAVNKKQLHYLVCRLDDEIVQSAEMISQYSNATKSDDEDVAQI